MTGIRKKIALALAGLIVLSACGCARRADTGNTAAPAATTRVEGLAGKTAAPAAQATARPTEKPGSISGKTEAPAPSPVPGYSLDDQQMNSVAMLNYLALLSQEISASRSSRLQLESVYSSLVNNTNPEKVSDLTEAYLADLLDLIEGYRLLEAKRERIEYLYEESEARAITDVMPSIDDVLDGDADYVALARYVATSDFLDQTVPAAVALFTQCKTPEDYIRSIKKILTGLLGLSTDVYLVVTDQDSDARMDYLRSGWELEDEEASMLHSNRRDAFLYMLDIVRENALPGELALNEKAVEDFVTWKNHDNLHQKLQFFESEQETYQAFGFYWLELARCYYENAEYRKCLDAFERYRALQPDIFRKDTAMAEILPEVISASDEVLKGGQLIHAQEEYLQLLIDNTDSRDWALRYFASFAYVDLYTKSNDRNYLQKAFDVTLDSVNILVVQQRQLNEQYLSEVEEIEIPADATRQEKDRIKKYNEAAKEARKTELIPICEPLLLNCEMLFEVMDELDLPASTQTRVEGILHPNGQVLFLDATIDEEFSLNPIDIQVKASYDRNTIILPACLVSRSSTLAVKVTEGGVTNTYTDWKVQKVERRSNMLQDIMVTYVSRDIESQKWSADSKVEVEIRNGVDDDAFELEFAVSKYTDMKVYKIIEFMMRDHDGLDGDDDD